MLFSERRYNVIDEIAELSLPVQPQLLCVPEKEKLLSIGSDLRIKITTPIVATTHCDLDAMVRANIFRKDLIKSCPHPLGVSVVSGILAATLYRHLARFEPGHSAVCNVWHNDKRRNIDNFKLLFSQI
jgi:hypothetical protein